jgi:hypothetical protein
LLYPDAGALFITERQVVEFSAETRFEESIVVPPHAFGDLLAEHGLSGESLYDNLIEVGWPCPLPNR